MKAKNTGLKARITGIPVVPGVVTLGALGLALAVAWFRRGRVRVIVPE